MTTLVQSRPATESISDRPERLSVHFRVGMPGLEQYHEYTLVAVEDSALYWLECNDEPGIALPLAEAFTVEPAYAFDLYSSDARALGLESAADALTLVVLTVAPADGSVTANLFAPVVINRVTGAARQIILDGTPWSMRQPVGTIA